MTGLMRGDKSGTPAPTVTYGVVATDSDPTFEDFVTLALGICDASIGAIFQVEGEQVYARAVRGVKLDERVAPLLALVTAHEGVFVIDDIAESPFMLASFTNALPNVRFCAGIRLQLDGLPVGAIVVMDNQVSRMTQEQEESLIRIGRLLEAHLIATRTADTLEGMLAFRNDTEVSRQAEAAEAVAIAESKYRAIFENAVIGMFQTTADGKYLSANAALARMYGYSGTAAMMDALTDIKRQLYVDSSMRGKFVTELALHDSVTNFEAEVYRVDGTTIWIAENARAVRGPDGALICYEGTVQDITQRKHAEAEVKKLNAHLETRLHRIQALRQIDTAITTSHDRGFVLSVCLDQVIEQLRVDAADIVLGNVADNVIEYASGKGMRAATLHRAVLPLGISLASRAANDRCMICISDLRRATEEFPQVPLMNHEEFVSYYAVPLISKGVVLGVMEVFHRRPLSPDQEWVGFFEALGTQVAIAVDNNTLFTELQHSNHELTVAYDSTIEGWSKALDLRDRETEGHTRRVTEMTVRLARAVGVDEAEVVHVCRGALLHDIGKMGVPDGILHKPGPLTDEEWKIMRRHPQYAYEWLQQVPFLGRALEIPRYHHEKWDGSGYPHGLSGNDIPLAARIFAVVDVWDALRSDRPYRAGWPDEKVLRHIRDGAGTHFDPAIVDVFLSLFPEYQEPDEELFTAPPSTLLAA